MASATTVIRRTTQILLATLLCGVPSAAVGQTIGPHAGISVRPEQFYFGAFAETPPLADRLRFRPSLDVGVGDDVTTAALNVEFAYHFRSAQPWNVYAGGGPALNIIKTSSDTDLEPGLNVVLGLAHEDGLFVEVRAGALDSPRLRLGVGYQFRFQ
jgi:hypothetical protein